MPPVLVTGAGRGIGLAITEHIEPGEAGTSMPPLDPTPPSAASTACPMFVPIALDITDRSAIASTSRSASR